MCKWLSAIVTRQGEVLCEPMLDSHTDLITHFKIHEDQNLAPDSQNFIRIEYVPAEDDKGVRLVADIDKYVFTVDERVTPSWFDDAMREKVIANLQRRLRAMIVADDSRPMLLGGTYIVVDGAKVQRADNARLFICGGTISAISGGTISEISGGTISAIRGGTKWGGNGQGPKWDHWDKTAPIPAGWRKHPATGLLVPADSVTEQEPSTAPKPTSKRAAKKAANKKKLKAKARGKKK